MAKQQPKKPLMAKPKAVDTTKKNSTARDLDYSKGKFTVTSGGKKVTPTKKDTLNYNEITKSSNASKKADNEDRFSPRRLLKMKPYPMSDTIPIKKKLK